MSDEPKIESFKEQLRKNSMNSKLSEVKRLSDLDDDWTKLVANLFSRSPDKYSNDELLTARNSLWSYGERKDIHAFISTINAELQRRATKRALIVAIIALIISTLTNATRAF